jgi:c-di-GMP-related signal transduction protein
MNGYYIHKEPVLDKKKSIQGYEVLFRRSHPADNGPPWPSISLDQDVIAAMSQGGGFERITGGKRAFVSADMLSTELEALKALPKGCVVQVPERDGLDKDVLLKSAMLKKLGYEIEISHEAKGMAPLHQVASFIRIDVSDGDSDRVSLVLDLFHKLPLKFIASGVEDETALDTWEKQGFELFQGPFFLKPTSGGEGISSSQGLLMQLSNDLKANKDVSTIEKSFKNGPKLTFGLLKLINSAFFGVAQKVTSIRHAVTLMGYENLQKWVVLLLFTIDHRDEKANPLIERAIVRGRVMEMLAKQVGDRAALDSAFMTGMLSLVNVLFNVSASEITEKMNLSQDIQNALLKQEGRLGTLLKIVDKMDHQDYEATEEDLGVFGLSPSDLLAAETDAIIESQSLLGSVTAS